MRGRLPRSRSASSDPTARAPATIASPAERRLGKLERGALADLDLDASAQGPAIRMRYLELVKRCHPDANGGDRSAETKLQRVIKAYKTLAERRSWYDGIDTFVRP